VHNRLLAALPRDDLAALAPHLEPVSLAIGQVLAEPGEPLAHVYFPETAIFSVINRMADGAAVEVGTVGNEGLVGLARCSRPRRARARRSPRSRARPSACRPPCSSRPSRRGPRSGACCTATRRRT
jgi:CRP-like cAMP-binding protein